MEVNFINSTHGVCPFSKADWSVSPQGATCLQLLLMAGITDACHYSCLFPFSVFIWCVCVRCLHVYLCTTFVPGRLSDALELELEMAANYHVDCESKRASGKSSQHSEMLSRFNTLSFLWGTNSSSYGFVAGTLLTQLSRPAWPPTEYPPILHWGA